MQLVVKPCLMPLETQIDPGVSAVTPDLNVACARPSPPPAGEGREKGQPSWEISRCWNRPGPCQTCPKPVCSQRACEARLLLGSPSWDPDQADIRHTRSMGRLGKVAEESQAEWLLTIHPRRHCLSGRLTAPCCILLSPRGSPTLEPAGDKLGARLPTSTFVQQPRRPLPLPHCRLNLPLGI